VEIIRKFICDAGKYLNISFNYKTLNHSKHMGKLNLKNLLKRTMIMNNGVTVNSGPRFESSITNKAMPKNGLPTLKPAVSIKEFSIIDLHCHPSLKMYLLGKDLRCHHYPAPGGNELHQQIDIDKLRSGYVRGLIASHYLVEASAGRDWDKLKRMVWFIQRFFHPFWDKIEHEDFSNFTQINIMIDTLESQIYLANEKLKSETFVIARSYQEFDNAVRNGQIPFAHAIEGAHALGRRKPISDKRKELYGSFEFKMEHFIAENDATLYLRNLEALKKRGVCLITLAHIFPNDISCPVEGISPDEKENLGMCWRYDPEKDDHPLTEIGVAVVEKMLDLGMIVDLTHSTPKTRTQVFEINQRRKAEDKELRPLTFTHTGSQHIFEKYDEGRYPDYKYYDVCKEEIVSICDCDGVIGIIPENFWLVGADTHLKKFNPDKFRKGIPYIIETMKYINSQTKTKDYDNIAIGTDFDGFADAPDDFFIEPQIAGLITEMKNNEFTDDQIKKIFYENARRLLANGWCD
jgi:microsomal dipeptidase-like Zn-dependent dipeptidase